MRWIRTLLAMMALLVMSAAQAEEKSLTVFAAASLSESLTEIAKLYETESGVKVKFNFGASGTLARQLTEGAPGQVFISAAPKWTKELKTKGLLESDVVILLNDLVLVGGKDSALKMEFTKEFAFAGAFAGKVSIGEPESVPAGKYAQEALTKLGWWDGVKDRLVRSKDVRETMRVVEMGGADVGVVYKTDALLSKEVKILGVFPADTHAPVTYTAGVVKGAEESAQKFLALLTSEKGLEIFVKYGFTAPKK